MAQIPGRARQAWTRWEAIAHAIGNFQARLLLSIFYLVIVPVFALIVKWKDPLRLRRQGEASFWRERPENGRSIEFARKQACPSQRRTGMPRLPSTVSEL